MKNCTLTVFSKEEFERAHVFLATRVTEMMGRKFEEGDWAQVYCSAKGIPSAGWSNTDIDIMYGNLGIEQKAYCRPAKASIKDACGTNIMHPAGTRAVRVPAEKNPTKAARDILQQYGDLIDKRRTLVEVLNHFHHGVFTREQAIAELQARVPGMKRESAKKRVPKLPVPVTDTLKTPELRTGWLLWQDSLREFLYFEELMIAPDPYRYVAEWNERIGGGSRLGSRNLWIYDEATGEKHFSVTTEAGVKIQPYFRVPGPADPNLYHFIVQGEEAGNGMIRVWLSQVTARLLQQALGSLDPAVIGAAIEGVKQEESTKRVSGQAFGPLALDVLIPASAYIRLKNIFEGVSDEHNFKQFIETLQSNLSI